MPSFLPRFRAACEWQPLRDCGWGYAGRFGTFIYPSGCLSLRCASDRHEPCHDILRSSVPAGHIIFMNRTGKEYIMTEEEENENEVPEYKPFSANNLNRILAILFVVGIYVIIFLKILVLD